jgi:putative SOS response-associated peptidase YedK
MEWVSLREYVPIALHWDTEGDRDYNDEVVPYLTPTHLYLEGGGDYCIDRIRENGMQPSFLSGGYGIRYTARTSCDHEENYDKVYYLYYEGYGQLGRWRYGDDYVAIDAVWDEKGCVTPTCIYIDEHKYVIGKRGILQMYPMSTRKTDGSGMRYIVKATCRDLRDYNREFSLMLEHGGVTTGRWFIEDAETVHGCRVRYAELNSGEFDNSLIEDSMGVTEVCARFQITKDISDFLRDWYSKEHDGVWLSTQDFEKKVKRGIIYPKDYYPVMTAAGEEIVPSVMRWGISRSWTKNVIFNLRCDKLITKNTFKSMKGNRCVIPCGGFYEFEKLDGKVIGDYLFRGNGSDKLYLAGLYETVEDGSRHYSIITTDANASVDIHDRMPVVLRRNECRAWLTGQLDFDKISDRKDIALLKEAV